MLLKSFPTRKLEQRTSRDHLLKVATAIEAKVRPVGTESAPLIKGGEHRGREEEKVSQCSPAYTLLPRQIIPCKVA